MKPTRDIQVTAVCNWYGSARSIAKYVGRLLEGTKLVAIPFAGSMSEVPYITARKLLVNDLHQHCINLARVIADPVLGSKLYRTLRRQPFHPATLSMAQARCKGRASRPLPAEPDLAWAIDYFICSWMGRGGKSGMASEFDQGISVRFDPNGGGSGQRYFSAIQGIPAWRRILRRCEFFSEDAFGFIDKCADDEIAGLYADPPFPGPGDLYAHRLSIEQQRMLAFALGSFKKTRVVARFYRHPLIEELYPASKWKWIDQPGRKQSNGKAEDVLLVLNGGE